MNSKVCAVHSIDHYALHVPSLAEAEFFYSQFGLHVKANGTLLEVRAGDGHCWLKLLPSKAKSLAWLSFNCFAKDLPQLKEQLQSGAVEFLEGDAEGLWFNDPDGNLLQIKVGAKTMPNQALPMSKVQRQLRGAGTRDKVKQVRPKRLSHVLLFTPDVPRSLAFYSRVLGLRLSDRSLDNIAFTHAPHGCDHHLVAFAASEAKGFHHAAWEVDGIDDVGNGAEQMASVGFVQGWGTGRHCLGSNYFHYVRDPWGSFNEYSAAMDYITAGSHWPAKDFSAENALYLWGPPVPDYFLLNTEIRPAGSS